MTDIEDELNELQADVQNGDEKAEEHMAMLSKCLAAEQVASIARRDLVIESR